MHTGEHASTGTDSGMINISYFDHMGVAVPQPVRPFVCDRLPIEAFRTSFPLLNSLIAPWQAAKTPGQLPAPSLADRIEQDFAPNVPALLIRATGGFVAPFVIEHAICGDRRLPIASDHPDLAGLVPPVLWSAVRQNIQHSCQLAVPVMEILSLRNAPESGVCVAALPFAGADRSRTVLTAVLDKQAGRVS